MIYVLGVRLDGEGFLLEEENLWLLAPFFRNFILLEASFREGWKTFLEQPLEFRLECVCGATCNLFEKKKSLSSSELSSRRLELGEVIYQLNGPIIRPATILPIGPVVRLHIPCRLSIAQYPKPSAADTGGVPYQSL